jgi:type I site-specific restriction endonuclease
MKYKVNEEGFLIDEKGEVIKIGDEPVQADGFIGQTDVDNVVQERLAREKKKNEELIKNLEAQANRTPELQKMLDEHKKNLAEVEKKLSEAEKTAQEQVSAQMHKLKEEREQALTEANSAKATLMTERLTNTIVANSINPKTQKPFFVNTSADVVPKLLATHKRETARDENGNPIEGKFVDLFEVNVTKKTIDGEVTKREYLPVDLAVKAFAADPMNSHYLHGNAAGGPGTKVNPNDGAPLPKTADGGVIGASRIAAGLREGFDLSSPGAIIR